MLKNKALQILIILSAFLITSCASKNFKTSLIPLDKTWNNKGIRFRIESVSPLHPDELFITGYTDNDYWFNKIKDSGHMANLAPDLQKKACHRYPNLFTDQTNALPLNVSIITRSYKNTSVASSFVAALSWGLFGLVLPLPLGFTCDYEIIVECPAAGFRQKTEFRNRLLSWISFPSPLALLPIPRKADRRARVIHPSQSRYYSGKLFTLECFAEAVVQALF
ncbi:MAG: hypothetical protein GY868_21860, partial [Deltaproteobacteria bacterium]|nr:hypothetical protein [Deltaproteobacteria bacterium]